MLGRERAVLVDEAALLRIVETWKGRFALATIDKLLATLRRAYRVALRDRRIGSMPAFPSIRFFNTREHFCDWPTLLALLEALHRLDPALADFTEWGARTTAASVSAFEP